MPRPLSTQDNEERPGPEQDNLNGDGMDLDNFEEGGADYVSNSEDAKDLVPPPIVSTLDDLTSSQILFGNGTFGGITLSQDTLTERHECCMTTPPQVWSFETDGTIKLGNTGGTPNAEIKCVPLDSLEPIPKAPMNDVATEEQEHAWCIRSCHGGMLLVTK